jgi:hypothetical protein
VHAVKGKGKRVEHVAQVHDQGGRGNLKERRARHRKPNEQEFQ